MLRLLVRPEVGSIVIEGIGGSGKTWAAKAAYKAAKTSSLFDDYIWVSLSENCSLRQCIDKITACLSCENREDLPVQRTTTLIKEYLTKRKFLLVLDNAYFTEENVLERLGIPHPGRQNIGSKVIVTTRTRRTGSAVAPDSVIMPQPLIYEEAYGLLRLKIGKDVRSSHTSDLINYCYGIPLSVILLAGVLCDVASQDIFNELVNNAWVTLGTKVSVFHTLQSIVKFAYHQLPNGNTRQCFLYCLLFPEDQGIPVDDLIRFWIMEGLVIQSGEFHEARLAGKEILDVLLKRASRELRHLLLQNCPCLGSENTIKSNDILSDTKFIRFPYGVSKTGVVQNMQLGIIGDIEDWMGMLWFLEISGTIGVPSDTEGILCNAELVSLNRLATAQFSDLNITSMRSVRELWIENCHKLEYLLSVHEIQVLSALGNLQNLRISNIEKLSSLLKGAKDAISFSCLKHLMVDCCPNLKWLFPSMISLPNLEKLHIRFCDIMEGVFEGDRVLGDDALPRLQSLELWELPELSCICGGTLPSLKNLKVRCCAKLRKIPVGVNENSPFVTTIGETLWWDSLIWDDESIKRWVLFRKWGPMLPHLATEG
ncbi:hypothetical protein GUJ93_ZPchr0001g32921 [Zizania palustris]|uniref:NB-ARC domain-containing protein n=1 Tax=Zizania palustris TaxID=103762 RepID=A0A8J5RS75_ZIZPA|nr:hypothetical protein GUJ93_ZPchr0001g32921 [Zizania palustris]